MTMTTQKKKRAKSDLTSRPEMKFLDHLEELRWRIIKCLISVILFAILSFVFSDSFIKLLIEPSQRFNPPMKIQVLKVQGMITLKFWVAFVMGSVFSIPVIAYQIWAFISPGLYKHEKGWAPWLITSVSLFFLLGAIFAYFVIIPFVLRFLIGIGVPDIDKNISINYYTTFVLRLLIGAGLVFQMPVLSFILTKMGLVTPKILKKSWRYAIVIIFIFAAFITPPDPVSMFMMGIPLIFLYEFSIFISKIALKSTKENSDEESLAG